jgi:hypothetical protein
MIPQASTPPEPQYPDILALMKSMGASLHRLEKRRGNGPKAQSFGTGLRQPDMTYGIILVSLLAYFFLLPARSSCA